MPTLDPRLAGLTKSGNPRRAADRSAMRAGRRIPVASQHHHVRRPSGRPRGGEGDLHHRLVHADRRGQHARADVGHVGQLEQALHRAVLAVGPVQHREDRRRGRAPRRRRSRGRLSRRRPFDREQRLLAGMRHQVRLAARDRLARPASCRALAMTSAADDGGRRAVGDRPPAVALDADRHRLVPLPRSRFAMTAAADASDTSCSPDRPP